jgi:glycosyltransferase involved in cell wall biosynthesis
MSHNLRLHFDFIFREKSKRSISLSTVKPDSPLVIFVLGTRFPTEKAYGVTTEQTALAVEACGFRVKVITPWNDTNYFSNVEIEVVGASLYRTFSRFMYSRFAITLFSLFTILFAGLVIAKYRDKTASYWTRDILIAFVVSSLTRKKVVCEIHRTPKKIKMRLLKIMAKRDNVILGPIGEFLKEENLNDAKNKVLLPMAINSSELCSIQEINERRKVITYLGNSSSSGIELSLKTLVLLAEWLDANYPDWKLELIGISAFQIEKVWKSKSPDSLLALGRLNRNEALQRLRESSIGLVIYPNNPYFQDSFPIKVVEYAGSGLAIVASDTIAHRRILDKDFCQFFMPDSITEICNAVERLIVDVDYRIECASKARHWATNYTYLNRVKPVVELFPR